ncbi:alpha/beta fold hydrolase [Eisenibacter elegans]|jgi:pimeloyl-ACP methyl ester carboxylesterase|uniref:alpha/beta fold hydrolase n=1 Tax=Eisenibacter elegans TaxID=997 RepID=UPI0003F5913F|nr:alpha/beta hydrolase [Eisenibacter elegans]
MKTDYINTKPSLSLYYERQGNTQTNKPPVVLIHGLGGAVWSWENQIPAFTQAHEVITLDLPGHGRSEHPNCCYQIDDFAQVVIQQIEALALPPCHLVGLSMGGIIAFRVAGLRPDLVRSLVIANTGPELEMDCAQTSALFWQREWFIHHFSIEKIAQFLASRLFPEAAQAPTRERFQIEWMKNDPTMYRNSFKALIAWRCYPEYFRIPAPVLMIGSGSDYTSVAQKERFVHKLPHAYLHIIPNSRHISPLDQPQAFNEAVLAFWAQYEA